jgi:tRNA/tmRNA/rRNA uracil-C5-methylase (TrmA/RlmC/RlmD family)
MIGGETSSHRPGGKSMSDMAAPAAPTTVIGPLRIGAPAHGGSCVARTDDGRVVFVRHAIPDELVRVRVVDDRHASWWAGEAVDIVEASPDRVVPPCPVAGVCGGCDLQHVALPRQRELKADVVAGLLHRMGGVDTPVIVDPVAGDYDGLGWRTRMRYLVEQGRLGQRAWHSETFVPVPECGCPLAYPGSPEPSRLAAIAQDRAAGEISVAVDDDGTFDVWGGGQLLDGPTQLLQRVAGREYAVRGDGFWQVHPGGADALSRAVLKALAPRPGEVAWDLYCGAGLFAGALTDADCDVTGVETSPVAVDSARANVRSARFVVGRVERMLRRLGHRADIVVLDPPRKGAGSKVVAQVAEARPRAIAYVACDPAALGRDLRQFGENGYRLDTLTSLDLFPMTHHVECVAGLVRVG